MSRRLVAEPVKAWKRAYLRVADDGRVEFAPLSADGRYGVVHVAECRPLKFGPTAIDHDGPAPDPDCVCGCYAVRDRPGVRRNQVLLEVALSGTVVVHERGFRAERQTVLGVHVPDLCTGCGEEAVGLTAIGETLAWWRGTMRAHCADHAVGRLWSLGEVASSLGTEVSWTDVEPDGQAGMASFQMQVNVAAFQAAMNNAIRQMYMSADAFQVMADAGLRGAAAASTLRAAFLDDGPSAVDEDLHPLERKRRRDEERRQRLEALDGPKRAPKRIGRP